MSGPVWKRGTEGPYICDECLARVETAMLEGEVVEGRFIVRRVLCERCYEANRPAAKAS